MLQNFVRRQLFNIITQLSPLIRVTTHALPYVTIHRRHHTCVTTHVVSPLSDKLLKFFPAVLPYICVTIHKCQHACHLNCNPNCHLNLLLSCRLNLTRECLIVTLICHPNCHLDSLLNCHLLHASAQCVTKLSPYMSHVT